MSLCLTADHSSESAPVMGMTEDEMAGWHHWLDGHESEWTPGVGDGQGGLVCCDSWGHRVRHDWATELNWTELNLSSHMAPEALQGTPKATFHPLLCALLSHLSLGLCACCSLFLKHFSTNPCHLFALLAALPISHFSWNSDPQTQWNPSWKFPYHHEQYTAHFTGFNACSPCLCWQGWYQILKFLF